MAGYDSYGYRVGDTVLDHGPGGEQGTIVEVDYEADFAKVKWESGSKLWEALDDLYIELPERIVRLRNAGPGFARVHLLGATVDGITVSERYMGEVVRGTHGWVPLTPDKVSWANPPQFPAFRTRREAAQALADGNFNY